MNRTVTILGSLLTILACSPPQRSSGDSSAAASIPQCAVGTSETDTTCTLFGPSLIALIGRPELYDGRRIRVVGYANLELEGNEILVSREDFEQMNSKNGLWLHVPDTIAGSLRSKLPGYVIVEGTFNARNRGHFGMWSGAIEGVTRLEPWLSRAEVHKRLQGEQGQRRNR